MCDAGRSEDLRVTLVLESSVRELTHDDCERFSAMGDVGERSGRMAWHV